MEKRKKDTEEDRHKEQERKERKTGEIMRMAERKRVRRR